MSPDPFIREDELEYLLDIVGAVNLQDIKAECTRTSLEINKPTIPKVWKETLKSMSLVCKAWTRPAQLRLFSCIFLDYRIVGSPEDHVLSQTPGRNGPHIPRTWKGILKSMSQVYNAWIRPAQLRLFCCNSLKFCIIKSPRVHVLYRMPTILSGLADVEDISANNSPIRCLILCEVPPHETSKFRSSLITDRKFYEWIHGCKHLQTLYFKDFNFRSYVLRRKEWDAFIASPGMASLVSASFQNITTFILDEYGFGGLEFRHLQQILSWMLSLKSLSLNHSQNKVLEIEQQPPPMPPPTYKLHTFVLHDLTFTGRWNINYEWILSSSMGTLQIFQVFVVKGRWFPDTLLRAFCNGIGPSVKRLLLFGCGEILSGPFGAPNLVSRCRNALEIGIDGESTRLKELVNSLPSSLIRLRLMFHATVSPRIWMAGRQLLEKHILATTGGPLPNLRELNIDVPAGVIEQGRSTFESLQKVCEKVGVEFTMVV